MADTVIDVVNRFTYEVDNQDLVQAANLVKANINNINTLTAALQKQQATLAATSRTDRQSRQAQQAAINATKAAIDKETKSLETNILANKELQQVIAKEVGLLGKLGTEMDKLRAKRELATDPKKVQAFTKDINALQAQISGLTSGKTGTGIGASVMQGLGLAGGFGIAGGIAAGASLITGFIADSSRLAGELEGVQKAFNRLDSPNLLDNLRAATKGTVSDLELMKQAVQFNNFGLPLNKLSTGLEFARIRAKETGQSVEYLVQSIVTGIGRQSPLILDNLGINARRVREEFQKTGDFAQAAFKIIQEETQKAGVDIETFTEKQARLNAQIENSQAKFGSYINEFKGFLLTIGEDVLNELSGAESNLTGRYLQDIRGLRQNAQEAQRIQANTDALFLQDFKQFADDYRNANFEMREQIRQQAQEKNRQLLEDNKKSRGEDTEDFKFYAVGLKQAYQRLQNVFTTTKTDLKKVNVSELSGYSKDQLTQLQEQIDIARTALTSKDKEDIERLNNLSDKVKENLDVISGANRKAEKKDLDEWKEYLRKKAQALKDATTEFRKLTQDAINAAKTEGIIDAGLADKSGAQNDIYQSLLPSFIKDTETGLDKRTGLGQLPKGVRAETRNAQLEIDADQKEAKKKRQKERADELKEYSAFYTEITTYAIDAFNNIINAQQRQLDIEISIREKRVESARILAERGNVEALKIEEERLQESLRQQQDFARQQAAINSALQLSYSLLAVAGVIASPASVATGGLAAAPLIAALLGVLANGYALATSLTQDTGFAEGGYTGDGGKYEKAGTVHKGEFVMPKAITSENRGLLEAIYTGKVNEKSLQGVTGTGKVDFRSLEDKMDTLIDVTEGNGTIVKTNVNERGVMQLVEKQRRINNRRFK